MIGEGKSREDRLWELRAAALGGLLAAPELANSDVESVAKWAANYADAMMAECDRRDLGRKKAQRKGLASDPDPANEGDSK